MFAIKRWNSKNAVEKLENLTPLQKLTCSLEEQLAEIKNAGTWKNERIITSPQKMCITVEGKSEKLLNFCANNYLGLAVS